MLPKWNQLFKVSSALRPQVEQNTTINSMHPDLPQPLSIRPMRATERRAIEQLGVQLFAPFGDYEDALYRWLRSPGVISLVVTHPHDGIVGFALVGLVLQSGRGRQAYLLGVGISTDWQRKGIGKILVESVLDAAAKKQARWGVDSVYLDVAAGNTSALSLFRKLGFTTPKEANHPSVQAHYPTGKSALRLSRPLSRSFPATSCHAASEII
jgi:ribosomal protein S18 acetylase RimI-like enzyme